MFKKNINNYIISDFKNVNYAINKLNKINPPILFVLDFNKNYIGTITDGDIRRHILKKKNLNDEVKNVVNKKSVICNFFNYKQQYKNFEKILGERNLKGVPVIRDQKLKGAIFLLKKKPKETPILIMAGGKGKRLLPYTKDIPKPLVKINNKPIIEYILEKIIDENFQNIFISINHYASKIKKFFEINNNFGLNVQFLEEKKPMGTAGSISLINKKNIKNLIVINSDILTDLRFDKILNYHEENKFNITIGCMTHKYHVQFGIINSKNKKFNKIEEKPILTNLVSAGINVLNSKILSKITKKKYLSMVDLINSQKDKKKIGIFPVHEEWIDVGNRESLIIAKDKFK